MTPEHPGPPVRVRWPASPARSAVLAGVAPGVDPRWAQAFLRELRLADVPGGRIGEALAEVASHCTESGETAQEAFGDPATYAHSLHLSSASGTGAATLGSVVPWVAQALGLVLLSTSAPAVAAGDPVALTLGHVVTGILLVASLVVLGRRGTAALRLVVERPVLAWLALMVHVTTLVAVLLLLDGVVARWAGPVSVGVGAAALAVGTVGVLAGLRRDAVADEPLTAPLVPAAASRPRTTAALRYGPGLLAPLVAVVLVMMPLPVR